MALHTSWLIPSSAFKADDVLARAHIDDRDIFDKGRRLKTVLITRPEPGAQETARLVSRLGHVPIVVPLLSVRYRPVHEPKRVAATVLTSRNAIATCPSQLYDRPAFTVGDATAGAAQAAGFSLVLSADGDANALAGLITRTLAPNTGTLFLPTGKGQGRPLVANLRRHGFSVCRRVAYETLYVHDLPAAAVSILRRREVSAAMFFSGEAARHFVQLLVRANLTDSVHDIEAVSISDNAAVALRSLQWRRIAVASKPNQESMLVLLQ